MALDKHLREKVDMAMHFAASASLQASLQTFLPTPRGTEMKFKFQGSRPKSVKAEVENIIDRLFSAKVLKEIPEDINRAGLVDGLREFSEDVSLERKNGVWTLTVQSDLTPDNVKENLEYTAPQFMTKELARTAKKVQTGLFRS